MTLSALSGEEAAGRRPARGRASPVAASQRFGRHRVIAPGHVRVVTSTRLYGWVFGGAGLLLTAGCAAAVKGDAPWPAVGFFALLSAAFLGVGLLPPWDRIELEIRPDAIAATRSVRLRGAERVALPRQSLRRVRVRRVVVMQDKGRSVRYPLDLVFDPLALPEGFPAELGVRFFGSELAARRAAEEIARALGAPFEDAVAEPPIVRPPEELDAPLHRENDPGLPPPGLGIDRLPAAAALEIRSGTPGSRALLTAVAMSSSVAVAVGVVVFYGMSGAAGLPWPALVGAGALELVFAGALLSRALLLRFGLEVSAGALHLRTRVGPLRGPRRALPTRAIEEVRIEGGGPVGHTVAIVSDERVLRIPYLSRDAAAWLRRWIAAHAGTA